MTGEEAAAVSGDRGDCLQPGAQPLAPPVTADPDRISTLELFNLYRDYIKHEDDLINQRTSWFIQLHSFLLASYGLTFAALLNSFDFSARNQFVAADLRIAILCFLAGITFVGFMSARAASKSITAAMSAICALRDQGEAQIGKNGAAEPMLPGLTRGVWNKVEDCNAPSGFSVRAKRLPRLAFYYFGRTIGCVPGEPWARTGADVGSELGLSLPCALKFVWILSVGLLIYLAAVCGLIG